MKKYLKDRKRLGLSKE